MVRRKGELSDAQINRDWPHQVALRDPQDHKARFALHVDGIAYCQEHGLNRSPRGHSFYRDDRWHNIHCFAEQAQAEMFMARFGGEWFIPGKGRHRVTRGR